MCVYTLQDEVLGCCFLPWIFPETHFSSPTPPDALVQSQPWCFVNPFLLGEANSLQSLTMTVPRSSVWLVVGSLLGLLNLAIPSLQCYYNPGEAAAPSALSI